MAGLKDKIKSSEGMKNISNVRTPTTPENKFRRQGLMVVGIILIIAGIVVWIVTANNQKTYSLNSDFEATTTETATWETSTTG